MDAFTAQIVQLVREMPDEAILALVRNQLGAVFGVASGRAAPIAAAPTARAAQRRPAKGRPAKKGRAAKRRARPAAKPAAAPRQAPAVAKPAAKPAKPAKPARSARSAKSAKPAKAAKAAKRPAGRKAPSRASADRQNLIGVVERIVRTGSGMSASQIASAAHSPQTRVANALKELKASKRIFQGGDRRFARYAGDPRTAAQASDNARKTASGPIIKKRGKR